MIGKGRSISHTAASIGYGWNEEKEAKVVYRKHLAGDNPSEITQEFKVIQLQNHKCKKNTLSFVISPTIEDGRELKNKELKEITDRFVKEMKLQERQAIAFVHQDKSHRHIHLYVNRIGFDGKAYKDNYVGKRSQLAAEKVAKQMGLTTVKEVQQQKLDLVKDVRAEIKQIHEKVVTEMKPKDFNQYINYMKQKDVEVIPSINKSNRLQGFRFEFKCHNLKGSEVHRSMSGAYLVQQIEPTLANKMHLGKLNQSKNIKMEIKQIHENVMKELKPKDLERYIEYMKQKDVEVIPSINKSNRLQGFKFEYKGQSLKGSELHPFMWGPNLVHQIEPNLAKEIHLGNLSGSKNIKIEIKKIHHTIITEIEPESFDHYVESMGQEGVLVTGRINDGQLQEVRFEYKGHNLKGNEIGLTTSWNHDVEPIGSKSLKESQPLKLNDSNIKMKIMKIHEKIITELKPKNFDQYIEYMNQNGVKVTPRVNKFNKFQGFRFEYKGHDLNGNEIHHTMSVGSIAKRIGFGTSATQKIVKDNTINILGKTVGISPNLTAIIAKMTIKRVLKKSIGTGMEL